MKQHHLVLNTLLALVLVAGTAHAQASGGATVARSQSGFGGGASKLVGVPTFIAPGFQVGRAALHPTLDLSFGYDSNVFYADKSENPDGSVFLTIAPGLFLANGAQSKASKVLYSLFLGGDYKRYFQELTGRTQRDFFGANLAGRLNLFPTGIFGFDLHETFVRTSEPRYATSNQNFDRDSNTAGLGFSLRPGGGLLQFRLGYRFALNMFEDSSMKGGSYYYHQVEFLAKWKFFPQTSFWLGATWQYMHYTGSFGTYTNSDSKPLRAMLGVTGRFVPKLVLNAGIGYSYSWYDKGPNYNLPIAMLDVTWEIGPFAKLSVGYQHNFQDVMWGNYYNVDTAYLSYYQMIAQKVELNGTFRWLLAGYEGFSDPLAGTAFDRKDNAISLGLSGIYHVTTWFAAGLSYQLFANFSNFSQNSGGVVSKPSYVKHIALLTARFSY